MHEKLKIYEEKMTKTLANLDGELAAIRAGRANPNVLNKIVVDYYGTPTPIQQVANVSVPEARMIQIQPWEKSMLKVIEKAIQISDLGINPTNDGTYRAPGIPGAYRGAKEGAGQGCKEEGRGCQGGGPQHPPGRKRCASRS